MIVVVILGVLAAVAVLAYRTYIRRARISEAAGLLANIKGQQESYRSEFHHYCHVNAPHPPDGDSQVGDDWNTAVPAAWVSLGFTPDTNIIMFQLDTISGGPGVAVPGAWVGTGDGQIELPAPAGTFQADHWFIARALGDQDGDGEHSVFWITQMTSGVSYRREVE
jgi:type II secretory pathway pseudopilin PulG